MLSKHTIQLIVFSSILSLTIGDSRSCYECDEEVWEEVPCSDITTSSTETTIPPETGKTSMNLHRVMPTATTAAAVRDPQSNGSSTEVVTSSDLKVPATPSDIKYEKCCCECHLKKEESLKQATGVTVKYAQIPVPMSREQLQALQYHQHTARELHEDTTNVRPSYDWVNNPEYNPEYNPNTYNNHKTDFSYEYEISLPISPYEPLNAEAVYPSTHNMHTEKRSGSSLGYNHMYQYDPDTAQAYRHSPSYAEAFDYRKLKMPTENIPSEHYSCQMD
uniref:Uncharacterized protein n=1 Tax=Glossina pallidipes TaxID=7398 RepID=A0A1A9ZVT8_GLOPL